MSFSSILNGIGRGTNAVVSGVAQGFEVLFGSAAAKQFGSASAALLKSAIGAIVVKVVEDLQNTDLSSSAKRDSAIAQVLALAAQEGITVLESEARMLIEIAVPLVKSKVTATAAHA